MMTIVDILKENCCGCTACYAVCGVHAIRMVRDDQGFQYPEIDNDKCVKCGLCYYVCPSNEPHNNMPIECYAAKLKDVHSLLKSTSGGLGHALAQYVVSAGGIAYGVICEDTSKIVTQRIVDLADLDRLRGSKYVQTDPRNTFNEVLQDLKVGKKVVYFGTSCHIDGLLLFLMKKKVDIRNLLTVDLICHGVPSPMLFEEYIAYISKRRKVRDYLFRTKANGWNGHVHQIIYMDGSREKNTRRVNAFMQLFFSNNCLRPNCYYCNYAGKGRAADITIADYWGIQQSHPEFYDRNGVSLVLINTEKGMRVFKLLYDIEYIETSYEDACRKQANQFAPSKKSGSYDNFWMDYKTYGFEYILKKYTDISILEVLKRVFNRQINRYK